MVKLAAFIKQKRQQKGFLLMPHLVLGYPDFATNSQQVAAMVEGGADIIELQIPFSEPVADGPLIANANLQSVAAGTRLEDCFRFAEQQKKTFPAVEFVWMTYVNLPFQKGYDRFLEQTSKIGVAATILPDLPIEEAESYLAACRKWQVDPIFIFTPYQSNKRLELLAKQAEGFIYCMARKGVTGENTAFDASVRSRLELYRRITALPLALGFGVSSPADVRGILSSLDILVIGSQLLRLMEKDGVAAIAPFLQSFYRH